MNAAKEKQGIGAQGGPGDPREIGKWARSYAKNRSLPFVVSLVGFLSFFVATWGLSRLGGVAYRSGNMVLFWVCIAADVLVVAALVYMSVPWWGGRQMERIAKRIYAKEGHVVLSSPPAGKLKRLFWLALLLVGCLLGASVVAMIWEVPLKYMQPVSAIFVVPFFVVMAILVRPVGGWPMLLWPVLYGLHAVLIMAGVPILFTGELVFLNILVPVAGYGILAGLVSHAYSRLALSKVKRLSRMNLPGGAEEGH